MSESNAITVKSYNEEFQTYVDKTAHEVTGTVKLFIDEFLTYIDKDDSILEIGSGTGRDALYIEEKGYKIQRTDAAPNFVKYMQQTGHANARVLDIINQRLNKQFDAILANAVFVHFDDGDFNKAIENVKAMLKKNGMFAISLHKGQFRGMLDHKYMARYYQEWSEDDIRQLLTQQGFELQKMLPGVSISGRKEWIMLIVQKG